MSNRIAPKLLAEFIGTFAFVFIGAGTAAIVGEGVGLPGIVAIAFAHGLAIMAFAFAYGSVSGGHMNPAVTVGVLAAGAMGVGEAIGYIVSQLIGGIAGALLLRTVLGGAETGLGMPALAHNLALGATSLTITPEAGFMIEALLAFFLMGGALTGAPFNPARALGPMVATGNFSDAWLYLTAPIVGAIVAAILHTGLSRLAQEGAAAAERGRAAETPAE